MWRCSRSSASQGIRCCLVTATRDRSDPDTAADTSTPWDERAAFTARRGVPWWGAVLVALGMAVVGAVVDTRVSEALGPIFQGCYVAGAVIAVLAVRRGNLFGPMVQPPLILAVTIPPVVLTGSKVPAGSDLLGKALAVGTPLINAFPMMALATALTVVLGLYRTYRERNPNPARKGRTREDGGSASSPQTREASGEGERRRAGSRDDAARRGRSRPDGRGDASSRERSAGGRRGHRPEPDEADRPSRGQRGGRAPRRDAGEGRGERGRAREASTPPGDPGRAPRRRPAASSEVPERRRRDDRPDTAGPRRPRRTPPPGEQPGKAGRPQPRGDERPRRRPHPRDERG